VPELSNAVRRLVQFMPKAELHLHLDGCLRPVTALELAHRHALEAPTTYAGMFGALVAPERPGTQAELLRAFDLPLRILQYPDALARVAAELVEDKAADRVRFVEVKWAPAFHRSEGMTLDEVIDTVAVATADAAARCGIEARLCVVAIRAHEPALNVEVARAAVAHRTAGVTGFDLAGYEADDPDPTVHAAAFEVARAGGLGITVHAGELLDDGSLVRRALTLRPDRISHGASAAGAPDVMAHLVERGITLDLCPTSNLQAGTVDTFEAHPLPVLLRAGVPLTINTDDATISDITLSEEWLRCVRHLGVTVAELWRCNLHALDAAFVDEPTRERLRAEFRQWAAWVPELQG
jgi:adenosine deaminase